LLFHTLVVIEGFLALPPAQCVQLFIGHVCEHQGILLFVLEIIFIFFLAFSLCLPFAWKTCYLVTIKKFALLHSVINFLHQIVFFLLWEIVWPRGLVADSRVQSIILFFFFLRLNCPFSDLLIKFRPNFLAVAKRTPVLELSSSEGISLPLLLALELLVLNEQLVILMEGLYVPYLFFGFPLLDVINVTNKLLL